MCIFSNERGKILCNFQAPSSPKHFIIHFQTFHSIQRFTVSNFRNLNDDSNENWKKNLTSTSDQKKMEKCDLKKKKKSGQTK